MLENESRTRVDTLRKVAQMLRGKREVVISQAIRSVVAYASTCLARWTSVAPGLNVIGVLLLFRHVPPFGSEDPRRLSSLEGSLRANEISPALSSRSLWNLWRRDVAIGRIVLMPGLLH